MGAVALSPGGKKRDGEWFLIAQNFQTILAQEKHTMKLGRRVNLSGLFSTTGLILLHLSDIVRLSCGLAAPMFSPFSCSRNKNNYVHCTPVHWSINRLCSNIFLALNIERSTYSTSNNITMLKPGSVCYQIKHISQVWIWAACIRSFLHCFVSFSSYLELDCNLSSTFARVSEYL